eukprot:g3526.t1
MTDGLVIKGGKTVRKVDVNEVLEGLEEQKKEETLGLMRVKVKAEKELMPRVRLQDEAKEVTKYIDAKVEELRTVRAGPLHETKAELVKMKPKVVKVQQGYTDLKKKVSQAETKLHAAIEEEKKRRLEAADRKAAADLVQEMSSCELVRHVGS